MKERAVIIFIAVIIGLLLTMIVFFIYQSTKVLPKEDKKTPSTQKTISPTPTPLSGVYLVIEEPKDEAVIDKRTVEIKGKTNTDNTIIISTNQEDIVAKPNSQGNFSVSITIDAGTNKIVSRAITPNGEEVIDERTISFTTEEF